MRSKIENSNNMQEVFDLVLGNYYKEKNVFRFLRNNDTVAVTGYDFLDALKKTAFGLQREGYSRSHIGIIASNSYEYLLLFSAVIYSGNVAVLISKDSSEGQIREECELADVDTVFYDTESADKVKSVCSGLNISCHELQTSLDTFLSVQEKNEIHNSTEREDLITIFFTSGTTGKNKAVAMSNRSVFGMSLSPTYPYTGQLIVLPMHHVAAISMYIAALGEQAETHICAGIESFIRDLKLLQSDCTFVVPMLLKIMHVRLKNAGWNQEKLGWNLKLMGCGGAAFPVEVIDEFDKSGIKMTETGGGGTFSIMTPENRYSIGNRILYGHEVDIIDGELVIKSCRQMIGYYKDPEETQKIMYDGWVHTGDLARKDENGYFYLIGRKKNLIILSNGENVSPEEIETRINTSGDVAECLVYGDQKFLHVCILPDKNDETSDEELTDIKNRIRNHVRKYNEEAPSYKQLRFVEFRDTPFERNALGKIIRDYVTE